MGVATEHKLTHNTDAQPTRTSTNTTPDTSNHSDHTEPTQYDHFFVRVVSAQLVGFD